MTESGSTMPADHVARLLLAKLANLGPNRSRWLLEHTEPEVVVERLRKGLLPVDIGPAPPGVTKKMVEEWSSQLRKTNPEELVERHRSLGIGVMAPDDPRWPFHDDPEPPALLFFTGDVSLLEVSVSVGVVGTRRCTSVGRSVAFELGRGLADAGVAVVSGLALGVDGAAHRGALAATGPVIGVVGTGLDVVYPGGNRQLWHEVSSDGLLVSEAPAGTRPQRWRFPARNRLIASLSSAVVIVESHGRGGALLTVDEAVDRGKPVFAVPGSVLSPASDGTNGLLVDGAAPVRHAVDVLGHLDVPVGGAAPASQGPSEEAPVALSGLEQLIMAEVATGPVHLDVLVQSTGGDVMEVTAAVQRMAADGLLDLDGSTVSHR
jgi:DNA processing protein